MTPLGERFLSLPLAHRGLHDAAAGRPENSLAGARAAVDAGYGIEIDMQMSSDGRAMAFHDYDLGRLTSQSGSIHQRSSDELAQIPLLGGGEYIPTLAQMLEVVAGRVPVLIEIKDQDGAMGPRTGQLEQAVADDLKNYGGDAAIMSFNPHSVALMARLLPDRPRGLVTSSFLAENWGQLPETTRARLRDVPDFSAVQAGFISHRLDDLDRARIVELRASGIPVLCWTVTSKDQEAQGRKLADNITFEGYLPNFPSA